MNGFEFDGALLASSGIAEALDAAGADACLPLLHAPAQTAEDVAQGSAD